MVGMDTLAWDFEKNTWGKSIRILVINFVEVFMFLRGYQAF